MDDFNFISVEKLKQLTSIAKSVDIDFLLPYIPVAEQMYVEDVLGSALTTELKTQLQNATISGDNETLYENHIVNTSAYWSWYEASMFLNYKTYAKGVMKQSSDNSDPVTKEEFEMFRQGIKDKAVFYRNRMLEYLKDNKEKYPLWRNSEENPINKSETYSSGIYLGKENRTRGNGFNEYYNKYFN